MADDGIYISGEQHPPRMSESLYGDIEGSGFGFNQANMEPIWTMKFVGRAGHIILSIPLWQLLPLYESIQATMKMLGDPNYVYKNRPPQAALDIIAEVVKDFGELNPRKPADPSTN